MTKGPMTDKPTPPLSGGEEAMQNDRLVPDRRLHQLVGELYVLPTRQKVVKLDRDEVLCLLREIQRLRAPSPQPDEAFRPLQFASVAELLRRHLNDDQFYAIASNNHSLILAALDQAALSPPPQDGEGDRNSSGAGAPPRPPVAGASEALGDYETVEDANAAGVFSGTLANGDTFGDGDDGDEGGFTEIVGCDDLLAALLRLANAADGVGVRFFDTDSMSAEVEEMQAATAAARTIAARFGALSVPEQEGSSEGLGVARSAERTPSNPSEGEREKALETGPELLSRLGMNAGKWCAEMVARNVVIADHKLGDSFHAWMCNAIMNAYDIGFAAGERRTETERMLPLLKQALLLPRPWLLGSNAKGAVSVVEWSEAVDSICSVIDRLSAKDEKRASTETPALSASGQGGKT